MAMLRKESSMSAQDIEQSEPTSDVPSIGREPAFVTTELMGIETNARFGGWCKRHWVSSIASMDW
jgi:hypothetical protein